ncbi:hypothetical protein ACQZ5N_10880 [Agrobacterium sp. 22-221-1]|jgi:hypothetical protein|uniref:hypothetical protein n=1 Tax=Agrobacterium leguminum TaxID=2792015 RepID=UPI0021FC5E1B|nr:hypothetical protein FY137_25195 [Agrobacterium tumefaciens]
MDVLETLLRSMMTGVAPALKTSARMVSHRLIITPPSNETASEGVEAHQGGLVVVDALQPAGRIWQRPAS